MLNLKTSIKKRLKTGLFFASIILISFILATIIFTLSSFFPRGPYAHSFLSCFLGSAGFTGIISGPVFLITFFLGFIFSPQLFKKLQSNKKLIIIYFGIYGAFYTLIILDFFIIFTLAALNFHDKYQQTHSLFLAIENFFTGPVFLFPVLYVSFITGGVIGTPLAILAVYLFKKLVVKKNSHR